MHTVFDARINLAEKALPVHLAAFAERSGQNGNNAPEFLKSIPPRYSQWCIYRDPRLGVRRLAVEVENTSPI
jgi:hypothetical protein